MTVAVDSDASSAEMVDIAAAKIAAINQADQADRQLGG